ncbi:MAG: DUF975 family protein [Coriobacteriia bacterium]|nr:DUF975 family protein [Coriobacteriia bacterium]
MKSRVELKARARELFFAHWKLLALSAAILWVVNLIQNQVQRFITVPEESIVLAESVPGMENVAASWREAAVLGVPPLYIFAAVIAVIVVYSLLDYGMSSLALKTLDERDKDDLEIFSAFKRLGRWLGFLLLYTLKVFAWSLLFVIPGIIAALNYSQAVFLMIDDEKLRPAGAIAQSVQLMKGRQLEYFTIWLSFLGFMLLAFFSLGFSTIYSIPYMRLTFAGYYRELLATSS